MCMCLENDAINELKPKQLLDSRKHEAVHSLYYDIKIK
jgi:hypothetical protein